MFVQCVGTKGWMSLRTRIESRRLRFAICFFEFGVSETNEVEDGWDLPLEEAFAVYREQWLKEGAPVGMVKHFPEAWHADGLVRPDVVQRQLTRIGVVR